METPSNENEEELSEYFRQYEDPVNGANAPNPDAPGAEGTARYNQIQ